MSRICRSMGDSGKLRFYELDHESKMRLLKTHSHTSNRLAMEPGTREGKGAAVAPAGCRIPATTTRERRLLQGHRRVHGVCTEGRLFLSVGDPR